MREERWLRVRRVGPELWLGVDAFEPAALPFLRERPVGEPRRWLAFRRVTRAFFYERYLLRRCQSEPGVACDPGCFSDALVRDDAAAEGP